MQRLTVPFCLVASLLGSHPSRAFRPSLLGVATRHRQAAAAFSHSRLQRHQWHYNSRCRPGALPSLTCRQWNALSTSISGDDNQREISIDFLRSRKRTRTWRRLGHLVDLAIQQTDDKSSDNQRRIRSVTDVGTDHGLLALALALTGKFSTVVGVDISKQALQDGAITLMQDLKGSSLLKSLTASLDFRYSDGLRDLNPGEADVVCVAGMGPHTMTNILLEKSISPDVADLNRLDCQKLILQPTNSRPRLLMLLYDSLQESGWCLEDERIEKLSSRWYITACFVRMQNDRTILLPGSKLASKFEKSDDNAYSQVWKEYVEHHIRWINGDATAGQGLIADADRRWLEEFDV